MRYLFGVVNSTILLWLIPNLKWDGPDWYDGEMFLTLFWWLQWPTVILGTFLFLGFLIGWDETGGRDVRR